LVFVTKRRRHVLTGSDIAFLRQDFASIAKAYDATIVQMDGEDDHVHVLVTYPPSLMLSKLVNALKGASSKNLRKHRPQIAKMYGLRNSLWSPSYFAASCGGAPLSMIRQYVENQRTPE
jgi:putative transposase